MGTAAAPKSVTSISTSLGATPTSGNLLSLCVAFAPTGISTPSMTGVTWTNRIRTTFVGVNSTFTFEIWEAYGANQAASTSTYSVTFSNTKPDRMCANMVEMSSVASTSAFDTQGTATTASAATTALTGTTGTPTAGGSGVAFIFLDSSYVTGGTNSGTPPDPLSSPTNGYTIVPSGYASANASTSSGPVSSKNHNYQSISILYQVNVSGPQSSTLNIKNPSSNTTEYQGGIVIYKIPSTGGRRRIVVAWM